MTKLELEMLWETLAIGMFYREQAEYPLTDQIHWEDAALKMRRGFDRRAKAAILRLTR